MQMIKKNSKIFFTSENMKRPVKRLFLFLVTVFLINLSINSQTVPSLFTLSPATDISGENIRLFTDRSTYCVNEKIYFAAEYSCISELNSLSWSNVMYVELIKWNGIQLARMKLRLDKPGLSGSLEIPGNILSGNYYLRAYTKWMRNFSVTGYAYLPVRIVNPFRSETDDDPKELSVPETRNVLQKNVIANVICSMNKTEFMPGEKAEVILNLNNRELIASDNYCISVAKVGAIDTTFKLFKPDISSQTNEITDIEYLPEIRGISISGKVVDKTSHACDASLE